MKVGPTVDVLQPGMPTRAKLFIQFYFLAQFIKIVKAEQPECDDGCDDDQMCCHDDIQSEEWYIWIALAFTGLIFLGIAITVYRLHAEKRSDRVLSLNASNRMHENRRFPQAVLESNSNTFRPPNSPPPSYWDVLNEVRRDMIIGMSERDPANSPRTDTDESSHTRIRRQNTFPPKPVVVFTLPGQPTQGDPT